MYLQNDEKANGYLRAAISFFSYVHKINSRTTFKIRILW